VLHKTFVLPEMTMHHVVSSWAKLLWKQNMLQIIFGEKTKHLSGLQS
jgi:hypothetical protein